MAHNSSSAPTRMLFLLHGEDPFRIRLRANELVHGLLAGARGERSDLATRSSVRYGDAIGLTRLDARADGPDEILIAGRSQSLFAAPDERRVVLVEHAESLTRTDVVEQFPDDAGLVLAAPEAMKSGRARGRKQTKAAASAEPALLDPVEARGGGIGRHGPPFPGRLAPGVAARGPDHGPRLRPA